MGAEQSKSSAQPMTFTNDVSVRFTQDMIERLHQNAEAGNDGPLNAQKAKLGDRDLDALVERRANERAQSIMALERERSTLKEQADERDKLQLMSSTGIDYAGQRKDNIGDMHSQTVLRDAEALLFRMGKMTPPTPEPDEECKSRQDQVIQCFRNHPGRSLDCWKEVEMYKESMIKVQKQFMNSASRL